MNPTAFECRCIRPGFVALPRRTHQYVSVATPCRMRRISPLDARRIHELERHDP
jgi:hypothetical protein